jgi:Uma2 family endonuclease
MSAPARHCYTLQDYLDIEEISAVRHEYLAGDIYAMAGGTPEHAALCAAIVGSLSAQLRGRECRPYTSDLRVRVPQTGLATYPDAAVICGPIERDPASPTHVTNPSVVFEVLSAGTEAYDRTEKRLHYQQLAALQAFVLVAQDRRSVEVWRREGEAWVHTGFGAGERVMLDAIGCVLDVDDVYAQAALDVP